MDIKSFGAKLSVFGEKAAIVSNSMFEKAGKFTGDMLEKTAEFTFDKLKTSPYCIATNEAFDAVKEDKKLIVFIVGDRENTQSKAIIWRMPLQIAKAWQYSATLKLIYAEDLPALVQSLGATPPSVCIYRSGELKYQLIGEKLNLFLENFDILRDWNTIEMKPSAPVEVKVESPKASVAPSESIPPTL